MSDLMGDWLSRDLFDALPEGIPPLDPEEDDEDEINPEPDVRPVVKGESHMTSRMDTYAPSGFDTDTSVGFFLLPDETLPGPEDPKHCTVVYLGHIGGDGAPDLGDSKALLMNVANIVAKNTPPITAEVTGIEPLGDEGAHVWMLDHPALQKVYDDILETDDEVMGLYERGTFTKYPEFKPHVTIGYETKDLVSEDIEDAEHIETITFDRLALWFGTQHTEFPLGGQ